MFETSPEYRILICIHNKVINIEYHGSATGTSINMYLWQTEDPNASLILLLLGINDVRTKIKIWEINNCMYFSVKVDTATNTGFTKPNIVDNSSIIFNTLGDFLISTTISSVLNSTNAKMHITSNSELKTSHTYMYN